MGIDVFDLSAKLTLDSSAFDAGLGKAKGLASTLGGGIATGLKVAGAAIGAATTAVVGFAASSVDAGKEFDKSMSQVTATMGKTTSEMEKEVGTVDLAWGTFSGNLRDYAQTMGANTQFTATQAADALNYMALAGYNTQKSMEMLPNVMNLAAAGAMDLALASDMITDTETAFGLTTERTTQMVDEMAKAASTGNTNVQQLGEAFLVVGGLAQELNGGMITLADGTQQSVDGVQELEIALTAMANAGIKGSEAGTHMRNIIMKLSNPTKDGAAAMEEYGLEIYDAEGKMRSFVDIMGDVSDVLGTLSQEEKIGVISDLFNTRDLASVEGLMGALGDKSGLVATQLREAGYATEDVAKAYGDFTGEVYDADSAVSELAGALVRMNTWGYDADTMVRNLQSDFGLTAEQAENAIGIMAQADEVVTDWDKIGEAITQAQEQGVLYEGKLYSMTEAQEKFGDSIYDAEAGFKILGAAQFMAMQQMDNLDGDMTYMESAFEGLRIAISDKLTPSLREFAQFGTKSLSSLTEAFKTDGIDGAMEELGNILSDGLGMLTEKLPEFVDAGLKLIGAVGTGLIENAPTIFTAIGEIGAMLGERVLELMQGMADATANFDFAGMTQTIIDSIVNFFTSDGVQKFIKLGGEIIVNLGEGFVQAFPVLITNAQQLMENIGIGLEEGIPNILPIAMNAIMDFSGSLRENAGKLVDSGLDMILNIADGLIQAIPDLIKTVPTIVSNIAGIINDNAPKLIFAGITLIGKLVVGIVQSIPTLIAEFPKIIKAIFDVITAVNWINLGGTIIKGIVNGIKSLATSLPQALKDIGAKAVEWLKLIQWKTLGKDVIDLIVIGVKAVAELIPNALKAIGDLAVTTFKNINWLELGTHLVEGIWAGITGSFDWITQRISEWAGNVFAWFKKVFKIESPSKLMRDQVGRYIGEGVAVGITNSLPEVKDAIDEMTDLVETPDISAGVTISNQTDEALNKMNERDEYISDLANAIVDAFIRADVGVEIDNREFGRLVRKVVTA